MTGFKTPIMNKQFIVLTTTTGQPIIIGCSSIAFIESEGLSNTKITLNYAENSGLFPKTLVVKESFRTVRDFIGV